MPVSGESARAAHANACSQAPAAPLALGTGAASLTACPGQLAVQCTLACRSVCVRYRYLWRYLLAVTRLRRGVTVFVCNGRSTESVPFFLVRCPHSTRTCASGHIRCLRRSRDASACSGWLEPTGRRAAPPGAGGLGVSCEACMRKSGQFQFQSHLAVGAAEANEVSK